MDSPVDKPSVPTRTELKDCIKRLLRVLTWHTLNGSGKEAGKEAEDLVERETTFQQKGPPSGYNLIKLLGSVRSPR